MEDLVLRLRPARGPIFLGLGAFLCARGRGFRWGPLLAPSLHVAQARDLDQLLALLQERCVFDRPAAVHWGLWRAWQGLALEVLFRVVDIGALMEFLTQGTCMCLAEWLTDDSLECLGSIYPFWRKQRTRLVALLRSCTGVVAQSGLSAFSVEGSSAVQLKRILEEVGVLILLASHRYAAQMDLTACAALNAALGAELLQRGLREVAPVAPSWVHFWNLCDVGCLGLGLVGAGYQIFHSLSKARQAALWAQVRRLAGGGSEAPLPRRRLPNFSSSEDESDRSLSTKKIFEKSSFEAAAPPPMPGSEAFLDAQEDAPEDTEEPAWGDEDNALDLGGDMGGGDWGGDLDLGDLGGLPEPVEHVEERGVNLTLGDTCQAKWLKRRRLPCDLVAAGDFEEALGLLKRRLGLMNVEPLEAIFKEAYWATCSSLPALPQMPSLHWPLLSEGSAKSRERGRSETH
ncbi:unnamed protein product [Effrenium voratum]|nr:unnamed protein product [Effrenium voratum]